ncbi:MAG: hypothetical protein PUC12_00560 [Clostridiales bacterium]|nr:hypothetical protein [Clostridiales bacterium]
MATKTDKKNAIRKDIIDSVGVYSQNLAGKAFMYVYGEEFFEVSFFYYINKCKCTKNSNGY